jgi:outer membrane receptor protein involved in Fe transport
MAGKEENSTTPTSGGCANSPANSTNARLRRPTTARATISLSDSQQTKTQNDTMNTIPSSSDGHLRRLTFAFAVLVVTAVHAQRVAEAAPPPKIEETITLSPFEVAADRDYGYAAAATLSGGRLATDLKNTAAAVSVLTRDFIDDIGTTDVQETLQWATNSIALTSIDIGFGGGNESSAVSDLSFGGNAVKVRGIRNASIARNFFQSSVASDTYSTERLDISRGPNALLFGDASLGGIINISTKRALQRNSASAGYQITNFGGEGRATLDVNRVLNKAVAVRVAALRQRNNGWMDHSQADRDGAFLTSTWAAAPGLQFRVDGEIGRIHQVNPVSYLREGFTAWDRTTVRSTYSTVAPPATVR